MKKQIHSALLFLSLFFACTIASAQQSCPPVSSMSMTQIGISDCQLDWPAVPGNTYDIHATTTAGASYTVSNLTGSPATIPLVLPQNTPTTLIVEISSHCPGGGQSPFVRFIATMDRHGGGQGMVTLVVWPIKEFVGGDATGSLITACDKLSAHAADCSNVMIGLGDAYMLNPRNGASSFSGNNMTDFEDFWNNLTGSLALDYTPSFEPPKTKGAISYTKTHLNFNSAQTGDYFLFPAFSTSTTAGLCNAVADALNFYNASGQSNATQYTLSQYTGSRPCSEIDVQEGYVLDWAFNPGSPFAPTPPINVNAVIQDATSLGCNVDPAEQGSIFHVNVNGNPITSVLDLSVENISTSDPAMNLTIINMNNEVLFSTTTIAPPTGTTGGYAIGSQQPATAGPDDQFFPFSFSTLHAGVYAALVTIDGNTVAKTFVITQ